MNFKNNIANHFLRVKNELYSISDYPVAWREFQQSRFPNMWRLSSPDPNSLDNYVRGFVKRETNDWSFNIKESLKA